jgi:hypothetical protein
MVSGVDSDCFVIEPGLDLATNAARGWEVPARPYAWRVGSCLPAALVATAAQPQWTLRAGRRRPQLR